MGPIIGQIKLLVLKQLEVANILSFNNGEFAMIGLMIDDKPLRAYSIASANYEDELEF